MSIAAFPHRYEVSLTRDGSGGDGILTSGGLPAIAGGVPAQFGGTGKVWSPEDLLLASLGLCLLTTFDALARRDRVTVSGFQCRTEAVLDRTSTGPRFTRITQTVTLLVEDQPAADRAVALLEQAERRCIIANALNVPVELVTEVQTRAAPGVAAATGAQAG